jgi:hypothetical protein
MALVTDSRIGAKTNRAMLTIQIERLLSRLHPAVARERRHDDRVAIPALFRLVPFDNDRQPLEREALIVVGKNISRRGVSFYHEKPITHRHALIELADPTGGSFVVEIDITWCRFTKPGWYESGGRLLRSAAPVAGLSVNREPSIEEATRELPFPLPSAQAAASN